MVVTTFNQQHLTPDILEAAQLTWYAAHEISRGLDPAPRYELLAQYPEWQTLLHGLRPFTDNWQPLLIQQAYAHSEHYGSALHQAQRQDHEAIDELVRNL